MSMKTPKKPRSESKPKYTPPTVTSEPIFEARALACGKCRRTNERRVQCNTFNSVS
jgi:hypothetical protein